MSRARAVGARAAKLTTDDRPTNVIRGSPDEFGFGTLAGMDADKNTPLIATIIAIVVVVVAISLGWRLIRGDSSLLRNVRFSAPQITPNADGNTDALLVEYEISRNATVSIFFENETGERFYFRDNLARGVGEYSVFFSGIVDGYTVPDEIIEGKILTRVLADGNYTWTVTATDEAGQTETTMGALTIAEADIALPEMRAFEISDAVFSPNRDGIKDRVQIQMDLQKQAAVQVYLERKDGGRIPIGELERNVKPGEPGRHVYDYEGGVDNGETPPPDGTYRIVGIAQDKIGQKMQVDDVLTIQFGGVPRADIVAPVNADTVEFETTAVVLCDQLEFTLTVENYGNTPIRTTGPAPGTAYDSEWNYNTLGWHTESGAWRVAIGYENELANYPYRWAVGNLEDLEEIDGHYYLMPGERAVVTGAIRITGPLGKRNPQPVWAGLIHEDVEISQFNNRVDPQAILIDLPDAGNQEPCAPREILVREGN